tara:strand:- start:258 stop:521 length:264 start_codon:yes stop_codon:yes gene_type:complete
MKQIFKKKIIEKISYWLSAIAILIAIPAITIFILRLGSIFNPLGLLIKIAIYTFCGGVTIIGFIAITLFFYESISSKYIKRNLKKKS